MLVAAAEPLDALAMRGHAAQSTARLLRFTGWLTIRSRRSRTRSAAGSSSASPRVPATVGDATGGFGVSKPAISKHLKVLEETGVVTRVVEGRTHRLSLDPDALGEAADWMDRQRALWGRLFDVVDEYLKEETPR